MATMKDIAKIAGVSVGTVDRALHKKGRIKKETAEKILQIAKDLNYTPNQLAVALYSKNRKLNIGFMIPNDKDFPSDFYNEIHAGAMEEIKNLQEYAIQVLFYDITFDANLGEDVYPELKEEEWEKLDGLITLGGNSEQLIDILKKADKLNIPVVLYNMDSENSSSIATVQCDYEQAGRVAAGLTAIMINDSGKVGILNSDSENIPSFSKRYYGFREELKEHYPNIEISFCRSFHGMEEKKELEKVIRSELEQSPGVNLIYVINPGDYQIFNILHKITGGKIRVIGNDLVPVQKEFLSNGYLSATITQEPRRQGILPLRILKEYLLYHKLPEEKIQYTHLQIHLRQNID